MTAKDTKKKSAKSASKKDEKPGTMSAVAKQSAKKKAPAKASEQKPAPPSKTPAKPAVKAPEQGAPAQAKTPRPSDPFAEVPVKSEGLAARVAAGTQDATKTSAAKAPAEPAGKTAAKAPAEPAGKTAAKAPAPKPPAKTAATPPAPKPPAKTAAKAPAEPAPKAAEEAPAQEQPSGAAEKAPASEGSRQLQQGEKVAGAPLKRIAPTRAQEVIREQVQQRTVDPKTVKLPQFPAPVGDRPKALDIEEKRREEIEAKEQARREALLEGLEDDERRKLEHEWEVRDKLHYRPDPDDEEVEVYPIEEPHAYVQIVRNNRTHEMFYHAIEPRLSRDEELILEFIEKTLVDVLDLQPEELEKTELEDYIRGKFEEVLFDYSISLGDEESTEEETKERLLYYVLRDFIGEGPLDILLNDPNIEDISCDGPHVPIFVYHRRYEALTTTIRFPDHEVLDSFVIRMAQRAQKHVSIAEPILDATMRDGSRLQATLAKEVSAFGSTFTLRKFKDVPFTPVDLVRFGTMSSSMLSFLWMIIEHHMSAIYAGGTASGKTTSINALMMFIPPQNKVVTIEDTRELRVPEPNWIAGITRDGFGPRDQHGRQAGEIDMFQLLKNALRQRPEYIVVGEVRGKEAYSLFQAMATGHAAYGTMHADSVDAVIHRLESDPINIPRSLLEALDVVCVQIQTRVGGKRVRRTKQITEVVGLDPNTREILTNEVFRWEPSTDEFEFSGISYALERIAAETGVEPREVMAEMERRIQLINHLVDAEVREYDEVTKWIKDYYKDPDKTRAKYEGSS